MLSKCLIMKKSRNDYSTVFSKALQSQVYEQMRLHHCIPGFHTSVMKCTLIYPGTAWTGMWLRLPAK